MLHKMKLQDNPFNMIKSGNKTIEMRLLDDKRRKINIKDSIIFTNVLTNEEITCIVDNLYYYKDFKELYSNHNKESLGYLSFEIADYKDMEKYYSKEEIKKYGVLAIKIRLDNK